MHVRRVILLLRGETTLRAYALPRQLLLRTAGRLALLFYSLRVYMRWFMQVYSSVSRGRLCHCLPPRTGLCIAGCVGHASVHCDSGSRAWRVLCFIAQYLY